MQERQKEIGEGIERKDGEREGDVGKMEGDMGKVWRERTEKERKMQER